ncbi:hypothetical protein [Jannaschia sp. 2305UL9-9]|uniref:hypothetical protein n=1 Tax=Jannaschia sp. 2305UL9-9 TaxID=3121638 RepID=UPI0035271E0F
MAVSLSVPGKATAQFELNEEEWQFVENSFVCAHLAGYFFDHSAEQDHTIAGVVAGRPLALHMSSRSQSIGVTQPFIILRSSSYPFVSKDFTLGQVASVMLSRANYLLKHVRPLQMGGNADDFLNRRSIAAKRQYEERSCSLLRRIQ